MKPSYARRYRRNRNSSRTEGSFFKKESEPSFFDGPTASPFFAAAPSLGNIQRKCDKCEKEEKKPDNKKEEDKKIQKKEASVPSGIVTASSVVGALTGASQYLQPSVKYHFSSRMNHDFGDTKIHTGSKAANSAKALNAKAYTLGNHIVFADGQFNPQSYEGKKLLAHELAHVVQNQGSNMGIYRMADTANTPAKEEDAAKEAPVMSFESGEMQLENMTAYGNCEGVNIQGRTDAHYRHSYTSSGERTRGADCHGCAPANCISETGIIESVFSAAPHVTLPHVPRGLNDCERTTVQNAINTTLAAHEQQHVDAFNTYVGTESTPYTYNGCSNGKRAFIRARHNGIEAARRAASNALSAALDPFNFMIDCDCPDTETTTHTGGRSRR
ncbi:MAG: DUF4157 domain-containing protein [Chitinophagaceae bacterium]